jgi:hypothetical protein
MKAIRQLPSGVLAMILVIVYLVVGYMWFSSSSTGVVLTVLFFPFVLAYAVGYGNGDLAYWTFLVLQFALIWYFLSVSIRSFQQAE